MSTIQVTWKDYQLDGRTITMDRSTFAALADQLAQYRAYGEAMRAIGRGFYPSSPFGLETTVAIVNAELNKSR